jgi:starch phosphorylase
MDVADIRQTFVDNLFCALGRAPMAATPNDIYTALAITVRDRVHKQGVRTMEARSAQEARVVAYLSAEFLTGPHLANNLLNLGIVEPARQALSEFGLNLDQVIEREEEPGLGNGGLGRLPLALWIRSPRLKCRLLATASVMSSASLNKPSRTAGRLR